MDRFTARVIPPRVARKVIVDHHYSHAWPTGNFISFGGFIGRQFVGVCTFGHPANMNNWKRTPGCAKPRDMAELTRLWVADRAPRFVESRLIAASLRILRRDNVCQVALSYADPSQGHTGTVYQASNWVYVGQSPPSSMLRFTDGSLVHKRAAFDRFGTDNPAKLRSMDSGVRSEKVPGKHRYLYPVAKKHRAALEALAVPYPGGVA